jgi:hypothetical protein
MQLLEDVFIIENLQVINEGRGSGLMKISGCFQRADEANNNKRIYRKPLLEREITKLATAMTERRLMGELDHPQHDSVKLSNVSHLITGLSMKGCEVIGEAEILNTPAGKVAQALIEAGVKIGISSRGMGTVTEELDGKRYVNEDFKLITWDIVADPSTRGAYPGLTESTQIQEIIDRVYPEAQKVKNFTTLLKEELLTEIVSPRKKLPDPRGPRLDPGKKKGPAPYVPPKVEPPKKGPMTGPRRELPGPAAPADDPQKRYAQNSSTQFVNFMRYKLTERLTVESTPIGRERSKKLGQVTAEVIAKERSQAYGAAGGPEEKMSRSYAQKAGPIVVASDPKTKLIRNAERKSQIRSRLTQVGEGMDDFDRATLDAEDKAKRTGKPIVLPKWKDLGKPSMVISQGKLHTGGEKLKVTKGRRTPMIRRLRRS